MWRYVRREWALPEAEARELASNGTPRAIRFKVPEGRTAFTDLVKGTIEFDNASIDDFVIVRRDGLPIYHLSVVCDDVDMAITHVIRGDDHVSNTPKHVLLFTAMGAPVPAFAHVPMILGPDKKRLSKRHGATSVLEYKAPGLPARGDAQLPRAPRLVARRRQRAALDRRSHRALRARRASARPAPCSTPRSWTG